MKLVVFKVVLKTLINNYLILFISFFHEITFKASELTLLPLEYHELSHKLDIVVFLKNYNLYCDTKTLQQAIFIIIIIIIIIIIMQDIVGKKSLYQNINLVQLAQVPDNKEGLIQLYDFQLFLDNLNGVELNNYFLNI
jgi:hypothetical protein